MTAKRSLYTTYNEIEYVKGLGEKALCLGKEAYRSRRIKLLKGQLAANNRRENWGDINPAEVRSFIQGQIAELR